ncbi:unnamed protein product [Candidula unifasciata]|uniref:C2H2-type domain-containing protein n=1 Tax=Candidula unifasciata TaxID=100452 RepID=A0A8S3Z5J9_9EUPU|nr:unnamed protein product [Candidula unifasciata]
MAEGGVRKSSRIKSRGPMAYAEDDLDLAYDLHLDISNEISSVLKPSAKQKSSSKISARRNASAAMTSSQQKNKGKFNTGRKTTSDLAKKVEKFSDSEEQEIKTSSETFKYVAKVATSGDNSANTGVECSNVSCSLCDSVFASEKAMKDHMAVIHEDEVKLKGYLICDICNQMCVNQSVYDKHMQLHSNCRKFRCEICQKAFADTCSFKRHMKSHDDERPYTCDLCMKSFRDNPSLSRHQRTHTDRPRMFNCLKCDKDFTDKHTLKRHERTHMSVRPFECETCSKTFSEPGSFRRHLKIHSGVRSFVCPVCSRSFLEKQSLLRHQKNVCGFSDTASLPSFFNASQSQNDCDSDMNDSDVSRTTVGEKNCVLNESTSPDEFINTPKSRFAEVNELMLPSNSRKCELSEKSNGLVEPKDAPSLRSLVQKDPELFDSISEIVESIDSYEKMLDLCGDTGQVAIDAALTREPAPMPDNLLCFECGELLVNGENFQAQGKSFHSSLCNSYKCLNCDEAEDYGEPPVLTAERPEDGSVFPATENGDDGITDETLQTKQKKRTPLRDSVSKNIFGTDEPHEHLRKRLKSQQGVFLLEQMYNSYADSNNEEGEESDTNDHTDNLSSAATSSRSHSLDSEATHMLVGSQDGTSNQNPNESLAGNTSIFGYSQQDHVLKNSPGRSAAPQGQQACLSITPKMEYEADDQSIPSVFPCHLCTKVFASSAFLTRHLNLHKTSPHKCMVCSKTFTNSQNLKRHVTTHTGEKPYTCPYCRKRFRDPSNFSKHKRACCALQSAVNPAVSVMSKSCVSSPQSLDGSGSMSQINATDLKQNFNFPSCSAPTESSASQDLPLRWNYDNDEEEDLPVSFGHPTDGSDVPPAAKYPPPDCSGKHGISREACEAKERQSPYKDGSNTEIKVDADNLDIPCDVCGKVFENEDLLEIHMKYHSSDPRVTCIECGKCFADPFGLKRHLRIHAGIRPHVCEYCGRGYCDNWSLRKHKSRGCMLHEVKVPADFLHPCLQCTRVFSESEFLDEHMNCHNGLLKFECDICQKGFSEAFNLKRHRRLHLAVCTSCDKEFPDVNSLNEHLAKECPLNISQSATSKETGFSCEECGRVYTTKSYLERHKKFHLDLKPYACEVCSKRFSEAFRLRRHLKVHKGEKPFSCETCLKEFTDFSSLKRHLSNSSCSVPREPQDTQENEYFSCDLCDKFFTKNYLLARHMNVHSKERPFTCDECGRTYKDTSSLKRHQLIHQGIKSFICPVCGKDFFYSDSLKRHLTSSCGKKTNPRRRRRGRGKGKRKSNNNINMRDRNTAGKNIHVQDLYQQEVEAERLSPSLLRNKLTSQVQDSSSGVKFGLWCCQKNNHCWRCSLKFRSATSFHKHFYVHRHKKPFHCPCCFFRSSRKMYLRIHQRTHKS